MGNELDQIIKENAQRRREAQQQSEASEAVVESLVDPEAEERRERERARLRDLGVVFAEDEDDHE